MVVPNQATSQDNAVTRLEAQLAAAIARAEAAEEQLARVHVAVRAFKQKQEQVAHARRAREARARATGPQATEAAMGSPTSGAVAEAFEQPDPTLDDRVTKYLESSFEPDRSRDWMLQD